MPLSGVFDEAFRFASDAHKYGCLWVPATASSRGRAEFYFDGQHLPDLDASWDLYDPNASPPPVAGTTAWSELDTRHMTPMLGTGAGNPMTVYSVEVWQASADNDIVH